jgi:WD40 repeat protein
MRVLPRTARGTWALAVAAWAVGCALAWWLLPARPRAVTAVPGDNRLLGVSPGGRAVLFEGQSYWIDDGPVSVPVHVWDTAGAPVRTVLPAREYFATGALSPNGRWLAAGVGRGDVHRVRIIDLTTGREDELACPAVAPTQYELAVFSPDSRWLAVAEQGHENLSGVRLWDVPGRRPGPLLAAATAPVQFSSDGRRVGAWSHADDGATEYTVWEVATGRELARLRRPQGFSVGEALTSDGTGLIVGVVTGWMTPTGPLKQYVCLDIADGRERWSVRGVERLLPVAGGRRVVVHRRHPVAGTNEVVVLNAADGGEVSRVPLGAQDWLWCAGPDGRTLLVRSPYPLGLDAVWAWLVAHGLPGPQPAAYARLDLLDAATGRRLHALPETDVAYAPDGQSLAVLDPSGRLAVWDVPPRKPLAWLVIAAALLALPLAWLARRRVQRLRRTTA